MPEARKIAFDGYDHDMNEGDDDDILKRLAKMTNE
jgi:hypothetical protein